jgi:hypothetical protein
MAQIYKKNEAVQAPFFKNGVTLDFYTITFPNFNLQTSDTASTSTVSVGGVSTIFYGADTTQGTAVAARNPLAVALEKIQAKTSIEIIGTPVVGTTSTVNVAVASLGGAYGTDDYASFGAPGSGIAFATYLTNLMAADSNTYQGYVMANTTVTKTTF